MPANDGVWLHEVHGVAPLRQHPLHQNPEHAVAVLDLRPADRPLQHDELMAQRDVLEREALAVFEEQPQKEDVVT